MSRIFDSELAATVAAVVEEGAFDAAARRLRITPSAVSQRVKLFEAQLGRVLLVRSRPVRPTEAGEAVLRLSRQVSLFEHDAAAALGLGGDDPDLRIRVSIAADADSLATWLLAPLTRAAIGRSFDVEVLRADQSDTARLLESGRVMAIVTSDPTPIGGCELTWLGALRYEAVAAPDFVARWFPDGVTPAALERAPFVSFDRDDALQGDWLSRSGVEPFAAPRHYVPSSHDLMRAVEWGLGWAMVPAGQAVEARAGGRLVPLGGEPAYVPLHWQQWGLRSTVLDDLCAEITAAARSMLAQSGFNRSSVGSLVERVGSDPAGGADTERVERLPTATDADRSLG